MIGEKPCNGARAEVVAVGEAAGKHDAVEAVEACFAVKDQLGLCAEQIEGVHNVVFTIGAGEHDHGNSHVTSSIV